MNALLFAALLSAAPEPVVVTAHVTAGVYFVEGSFSAAGSVADAWSVLTDYERLPSFVPSLRKSTVSSRDAGTVVVVQEGEGRALWFSRSFKVVLTLQERAPTAIDFADGSREDFALYEGGWTLDGGGGRTTVHYRLHARPKASVPELIARPAFERSIGEQLEQVRAEIERRGGRR